MDITESSLKRLATVYKNESTTLSEYKQNLRKLGQMYLDYLNLKRKKDLVELSGEHIAYVLFELWDMVYEESTLLSDNAILYIYNPVTRTYTESLQFWEITVQALTLNTDVTIDIHKRTSMVFNWCRNSAYLTDKHCINKLPEHVLAFKNGLYDLRKNKFYDMDYNESPYDDCHITKRLPQKYINKSYNEFTKQEKAYMEIIERVFNDWSSQNSYNLKLLQEIIMATMLGNNFSRMVVIQGPGGNGKSTYINIIKRIIGHKSYLPMNIYQISDDNFLNQLSSNMHAILGDDSATDTVIKNKMTAVFKSLTTRGELLVNKKYHDAMIISTTAMFIQSTNTQIVFLENTNAIRDRILYMYWTTENFRNQKATLNDTDKGAYFDLDSLINDDAFIQMIIHYIIKNVGYMQGFSNVEYFVQNTKEVLDANDSMVDFVKDLLANGFIITDTALPKNLLYRAYVNYCKQRNVQPQSDKKFQRRINSLLEEYGFIKKSRQYSSKFERLMPLAFDVDRFCNIYNITKETCKNVMIGQFQTIERESLTNVITEFDIEKVRQQLDADELDDDIDNQNPVTLKVLSHLAKNEFNTKAQSLLGY